MTYREPRWTNPSVLAFAQEDDPLSTIRARARHTVVEASEQGWQGPPYDPFQLAELLGINVLPNDAVDDARIVPVAEGLRIEFNPNRAHGRIRYSVAHELAHTFFPDCADVVRNRTTSVELRDDDWQLELLCNVGAAELLMPTGYRNLAGERIEIDNLLRLRSEFDVSTEAIMLRIAKLTNTPCAMFAAARIGKVGHSPEFRIDYSIPSRTWGVGGSLGFQIESSTVLSECTAIGFTAKGTENWGRGLPSFDVQCVGIPPFPGDRFPRIVGFLSYGSSQQSSALQITNYFGDARRPRGTGKRIIAHVVNDRTPNWGGGFAMEVAKEWGFIQEDFLGWVKQDRRNLSLGNIHWAKIEDDLSIVHMVAQRGYGRSTRPRIRYAALRTALDQLHEVASGQGASVHMPRIGTGQAGGNWELVRELVDEHLVQMGTPVSIYTLPDNLPSQVQGMLDF